MFRLSGIFCIYLLFLGLLLLELLTDLFVYVEEKGLRKKGAALGEFSIWKIADVMN